MNLVSRNRHSRSDRSRSHIISAPKSDADLFNIDNTRRLTTRVSEAQRSSEYSPWLLWNGKLVHDTIEGKAQKAVCR